MNTGFLLVVDQLEEVFTMTEAPERARQLAELLIGKHGVALVAGSAFGAPGCVRLSYAISDDRLAQELDRIERALATG